VQRATIKFELPFYTDEETKQNDINDIVNYIQKVTYTKDIEVEIEKEEENEMRD